MDTDNTESLSLLLVSVHYLRVGDVMMNSACGGRAGWVWPVGEGYRTTWLSTLVIEAVMEHSWESKGYISRLSSQCTLDSNSKEYSKSLPEPEYSRSAMYQKSPRHRQSQS